MSNWIEIGALNDIPVLGSVRVFDLGGVIGAAGLLVAFTVSAIRNTRALYLAEPMPQPSTQEAVECSTARLVVL